MTPLNPPAIWPVPEQFRPVQLGVAPDGAVGKDFAAQCELAMNNVEALLVAAGLTLANVVKLTYFLTRSADVPELGNIRRRRWASPTPPAASTTCRWMSLPGAGFGPPTCPTPSPRRPRKSRSA